MIAAAGYIINDYFDVRIDKVNKPQRMVIDKGVKRRVAIGAHTVINILAVLLGFLVSLSIGNGKLVIFHIVCATGLWFYSTTFKRKFLIGNLVIAVFTALVPLIIGIYELEPFRHTFVFSDGTHFHLIAHVVTISFFAFITTLLREILKDMEDMEGDREYGCKTMPIVLGVKTTKWIVIGLSAATMAGLAYIQYRMRVVPHYLFTFGYFTIALLFPLIFLIWKTLRAETKKEFRFAGNTAKFIMLTGICYLFIYACSIHSTYGYV
jgi:4-hydroxybenzoate polyprenyltransferase